MFINCDTDEYVNVNHVTSFVEREDGTVVLRVNTGVGPKTYTAATTADFLHEMSDRKQFVLALPGHKVLVARYDGLTKTASFQQNPLIGWELGGLGDLMPVSVHGRLDPLTDWAIEFPDGAIHSFYYGAVSGLSDWKDRIYARNAELD